jgi:hypothetical protein
MVQGLDTFRPGNPYALMYPLIDDNYSLVAQLDVHIQLWYRFGISEFNLRLRCLSLYLGRDLPVTEY